MSVLTNDAQSEGAAPLRHRIQALQELNLEQLRREWRRIIKTSPHNRLTADLLRRGIAYRLQEAALGGLSHQIKRKLTVAGEGTKSSAALQAADIKPGTTLVREWHGRTHTVRVLTKGFEFEGRHYKSLTKLAQEITGAAWSGPRFFGLTGKATRSQSREGGADA